MESPHYLLTPAEMAQADARTIARGVAGIELMEAAGKAVADVSASVLGADANTILILCGPGNNGGDGLSAARLLRERGFNIRLCVLYPESGWSGDAGEAARRYAGPFLTTPDYNGVDLVIDALFGAGLARDIEGRALNWIEELNHWSKQSQNPVIAIDIPSGIDGATGKICGVAVRASHTVTFHHYKPAHLLMPARLLCGVRSVHDIGIDKEAVITSAFVNEPALWRDLYPVPEPDGHKYKRGHTLVMSGDYIHTGAARLSAGAALRIGSGLVSVAGPQTSLAILASHLTAIMIVPCDDEHECADLLQDKRKNSFVLGPALGVGERTRRLVWTVLEHAPLEAGLVLDADALTSFAGDVAVLARGIAASKAQVILTPHEGEFARLFPDISGDADKLTRAREAARMTGATVLLKGADSVVAHHDGRASISFSSSPWLATAGAGDVLAGMIGGLLAQDMPAFEATSAAVWLHNQCAQEHGAGLIAEDIAALLPPIMARLTSILSSAVPLE
jgi:ADP-dependent NAD(P)H-hydrate dehydratase / NAD(P)H-hydrate epimerase